MYSQALQLTKKALLYSWILNSSDEEIECYDLMGLAYFYLGDI